jgi:uncharacterized integral membrane protein
MPSHLAHRLPPGSLRRAAMSVVRWILAAVVFIALLFISLQNADPVTLRLFSLYEWQAPLVFVVLVAFASGVAFGLLAGAIKVVRLKRQVARMRREQRAAPSAPATHAPGSGPATGSGFEPPSTGF